MSLEVVDLGGLATFQDGGRLGWRRFGVPASGPMDWFAHRAANALVGNSPGAAAIELGLGEITLRATSDCVVAAAGAGYEMSTSIWTFPLWCAIRVRGGEILRLKKTSPGNWVYLAVAGGFEVEPVLGSRSTYPRGGLGRMLQTGERLKVGKPARPLDALAARTLSPGKRCMYGQSLVVDVILGPQAERFDPRGIETLLESEYTLSASFDRMGYRLEGSAIANGGGADLISEGMVPGSVQVPANGLPIVMMADGPTTGGYPKIACVARADLPRLAQCEPGLSRIRFRATTVEAAQARYRQLDGGLEAGIVAGDDWQDFVELNSL